MLANLVSQTAINRRISTRAARSSCSKSKFQATGATRTSVWTLSSRGKTEKAYGSLMPIWELGSLVYLENRHGAAFLRYPEEPNTPPSIELAGSAVRSTGVGEPITLTAEVSDDGYPRPVVRPGRPSSGARERGRDTQGRGFGSQSPISQAVVKLDPGVRLGLTWVLYRGPSQSVTFDPVRVAVATAVAGNACG